MQPFSFTLSDGVQINIIGKISGRKRSLKLLFIKIRRSQTLIAYSAQVKSVDDIHYTIYKVRKTGAWQPGADSSFGRLTERDKRRTGEIKSAIDHYESKISPIAYKELF